MLHPKRLKLFFAHLLISSLILLVLMYLIFYRWYPHDLFFTSGGWNGTKIVFFVDMVLGPALTLILSNPTKKNGELIRDLCFCALIQIGALSYGVGLLLETRPVVLSIYDGAIHTLQGSQIENVPDQTAFEGHANTPPLIYSDDVNRYDLSIPKYKKMAETVLEFGQKYGVPVHATPITFDLLVNREKELYALTSQSLNNIQHNSNYTDQQITLLSKKGWYVIEIDGSFKDGYLAFDIDGKVKESICCH